jgi:hypothetical protein
VENANGEAIGDGGHCRLTFRRDQHSHGHMDVDDSTSPMRPRQQHSSESQSLRHRPAPRRSRNPPSPKAHTHSECDRCRTASPSNRSADATSRPTSISNEVLPRARCPSQTKNPGFSSEASVTMQWLRLRGISPSLDPCRWRRLRWRQ